MSVRPPSIRARLIGGGAAVLLAFLAIAGIALERAHADGVRAAHYARLQGTVYLLLAGAELDASNALVMPREFAEPRLSLPGSGLYASVLQVPRNEAWQSPSTIGLGSAAARLPFQRSAPVGEWRYETLANAGGAYLAASYGVSWAGAQGSVPLVLSVLESRAAFDRETGAFRRTLWAWLGGAGIVLLLSQTLLLQWGLRPLQRVSRELERIERGEQAEVEGHYPAEITGLTGNLNTLIRQERVRQTRYKEALSFLAHSLKTPLAVLRNAMAEPRELPATVEQQVSRMDHIVQHQLGRAAASGSARFAPYLKLAPVAQRIRDSLAKVYAGKALAISLDCPAHLEWRIDEGDAFELIGNLMDNASKWAAGRVAVRLWHEASPAGRVLRLRVDDDGPGFTDTESILQIHVRADEKVPGHGVGLAVVNDLVASHDGELVLTRSELGGGRVDVTLRTV
ncbi:MAG: histidine kinase [Comamonadaceae bacterium]|nr:MAG: histidine kinase [Comamonadaceae bacterium]